MDGTGGGRRHAQDGTHKRGRTHSGPASFLVLLLLAKAKGLAKLQGAGRGAGSATRPWQQGLGNRSASGGLSRRRLPASTIQLSQSMPGGGQSSGGAVHPHARVGRCTGGAVHGQRRPPASGPAGHSPARGRGRPGPQTAAARHSGTHTKGGVKAARLIPLAGSKTGLAPGSGRHAGRCAWGASCGACQERRARPCCGRQGVHALPPPQAAFQVHPTSTNARGPGLRLPEPAATSPAGQSAPSARAVGSAGQ